jgi:hypothetical protein
MFGLLKKQREPEIQQHVKEYECMEDVSSVYRGYRYWQHILRGKVSRLFVWHGLPVEIPVAELEHIILREGLAGIVSTDLYGYVAVPAHQVGVGLYPFYSPYATWCTPLVEGSGVVNRDIVLIRNDSYCRGINQIIDRYARMLSDAESTLINTLSNVRRPTVAAAPDEAIARSYQAADLAVRLGYTSAVIDDNIISEIKMLPAINTIPADLLGSINEVTTELIRRFFSELGVGSAPSKRAPMTESEIAADNQICIASVEDMLESRREAIPLLEDVYALSGITVEINPKFKPDAAPRPADFAEGDSNYTTTKEVAV